MDGGTASVEQPHSSANHDFMKQGSFRPVSPNTAGHVKGSKVMIRDQEGAGIGGARKTHEFVAFIPSERLSMWAFEYLAKRLAERWPELNTWPYTTQVVYGNASISVEGQPIMFSIIEGGYLIRGGGVYSGTMELPWDSPSRLRSVGRLEIALRKELKELGTRRLFPTYVVEAADVSEDLKSMLHI